jgi:hypothetical protein
MAHLRWVAGRAAWRLASAESHARPEGVQLREWRCRCMEVPRRPAMSEAAPVYAAPGIASLCLEQAARAVWLACRCGGAPQVIRPAWCLVWPACSLGHNGSTSGCAYPVSLEGQADRCMPTVEQAQHGKAVPHSISTWATRWSSYRLERGPAQVACAHVAISTETPHHQHADLTLAQRACGASGLRHEHTLPRTSRMAWSYVN